MEKTNAYLLLNRQIEVAARCALGDGLSRQEVFDELSLMAEKIVQPFGVDEDMSPIFVPME